MVFLMCSLLIALSSDAVLDGSKSYVNDEMTLDFNFFMAIPREMTNQENPSKSRVNISITGDHAEQIELLRTLLERRMNKRLSIAKVIKKLTEEALHAELVVK